MRFENKTALVTGAGQGIGRAIAIMLAQQGAKVVVNDINLETAQNVAKEINALPGQARPLKADISCEGDVAEMVSKALKEFSGLDILINNAGITNYCSQTDELSTELWDRAIAINLRGTFLCSRAVLGHMKKQRYGKIINISSLAGQSGGIKVGADYSASKAGIIAFTKKLALELAGFNINVNAVAPATTETEMIKQMSEQQRDDLRRAIPLGRFGQPEDIAQAVCFLASEEASFITGATLDVNGGLLMR